MRIPSRPLRRQRRRRSAAALVLTALSVALATLTTVPSGASNGSPARASDLTGIRIIQANLLSGQPDRKFAADLRSIFVQRPDFITYNEVSYRPDAQLAPPGYALFRTPGKYQGATPVAWRSDRWEPLAVGTRLISNRKGKTPSQSVHWGIRYANWATLREYSTGQVVSVVSTHLAPKSKITEGLARPSVRRLGVLTAELAASGPVLLGGDFNFHYTSKADYPRDVLASAGMTPTYDVTGTYTPTGDHRGATIDYVFMHLASQFEVRSQVTTELNSDHDALTVDLGLLTGRSVVPVSFRPGKTVNNPRGTRQSRRAVLDLLVRATDAAPAGAGLHLETEVLADRSLYRALLRAKERGVYIQFLTRRARPNAMEKALFRLLGRRLAARQWAVGCNRHCREVDRRLDLPPTRLLISTAGATKALRIDSDRAAAFARSAKRTTAITRTSVRAYDRGFRQFLRQVGRAY